MNRSKLMGALLGKFIFLGGLFLFFGCQETKPTHYIEKQSKKKPSSQLPGMHAGQKMGGDMTPGKSSGQLVMLPFEYSIPRGWRELSPQENKGMRARTFVSQDSLECTFVLLGGQGGGMMQNLERWAKQLGLDPSPQDMEVFRSTSKVWDTQSPWKAEFFDFRKFDQSAQETILAVVIPLDAQTLFVKMKGSSEKLAGELNSLKSLIASVKPLSNTSKQGAI